MDALVSNKKRLFLSAINTSVFLPIHARSLIMLTGLLVACFPVSAAERSTLVILDLGITDTMYGEANHHPMDEADSKRMKLAAEALREALTDHPQYQLVDHRALDAAVESAAQEGHQAMHRCASCQMAVAETLGADFILAGHVRKTSNLILVMSLELRDVQRGTSLERGQVHMRGNTDESWRRAALYLLEHELALIAGE